MEDSTVLLFTASYPFSIEGEQTFIEPELPFLLEKFDRLILIPGNIHGKRFPCLDGIEVEEGYARRQESASKAEIILSALRSRLFYEDIRHRPQTLWQPQALGRLFNYLGRGVICQQWVERYVEEKKLSLQHCLFYTWWLTRTTLGIGLYKEAHPALKLVSRTHGGDLYAERFEPPYIPCREMNLTQLNALYPDAHKGREYMISKYPWIEAYCQTGKLGVQEPGFLNAPSTDGVFRIKTCATMKPIKRLDLLLQGIDLAARMRPDQRFDWRHYGEGALFTQITQMAQSVFPPNVSYQFPGWPYIAVVMEDYRQNPVDVTLNVSISEGTPVAIMEAISCGIPVIATAVGGNPEIVFDHDNGLLLSPNPSAQEIADALLWMIDHPQETIAMRKRSRRLWEEAYDSDKNYRNFVSQIRGLIA